MKVSSNGIRVIQYFEDCSLDPYPDPASPLGVECAKRGLRMPAYRRVPGWEQLDGSPWTGGWGSTGPHVVPGVRWTQAKADAQLLQDLERFEQEVLRLLTIKPTQGQFDALVSFAYNVGSDIDADKLAEGLGDSTLLRCFNAGEMRKAQAEFGKWINAGGKPMRGLKRRRAAEAALFAGATGDSAIATGRAVA